MSRVTHLQFTAKQVYPPSGPNDRHPHQTRIVQDEELGGVISAQLFGHVHKDEIRILPQAPKGAGHDVMWILVFGVLEKTNENWWNMLMHGFENEIRWQG